MYTLTGALIPAKAGIQFFPDKSLSFSGFPPTREQAWIPASAGMTVKGTGFPFRGNDNKEQD